MEIGAKFTESSMPFFPLLLRCVQAIPHVTKKLNLHDMYFLHRNARYLGPCLVRICVVVEKLVAKHESYRQQTVLAAGLPLDRGVRLLQPVDEEECQENDVLSNLRRREDRGHPFAEASCRRCIRDKRLYGLWGFGHVKHLLQHR